MGDEYNDNPGPGAYCIKDTVTKEQAPIYSLGAKLKRGGDEDHPGPGTYSPRFADSSPAYSLPVRFKGKSHDDNPGPGTYSSHMRYTQSCSPAYTIAARLHDAFTSGKNPGPGAYDPHLGPGGPSFSFRARSASDGAMDKNPGPGAYDPFVHNCIPAYSLGKRLHGNARDENPGPGAYNMQQKRDGAAFTMRGRLDRKRPPGRNNK